MANKDTIDSLEKLYQERKEAKQRADEADRQMHYRAPVYSKIQKVQKIEGLRYFIPAYGGNESMKAVATDPNAFNTVMPIDQPRPKLDDSANFSEIAVDAWEYSERASREVAPLVPSAHDLSRHVARALRRLEGRVEFAGQPTGGEYVVAGETSYKFEKRYVRVFLDHETVIAKNIDRARSIVFKAAEKFARFYYDAARKVLGLPNGASCTYLKAITPLPEVHPCADHAILHYRGSPVRYLESYDGENTPTPRVAHSPLTDQFVLYLASYFAVVPA